MAVVTVVVVITTTINAFIVHLLGTILNILDIPFALGRYYRLEGQLRGWKYFRQVDTEKKNGLNFLSLSN
jgi:hypothetical protein